MNRTKYLSHLLTALIIGSFSLCFAVNKTGTTAANFLKIGAGSRAVGMGGAFVAVADDASSMYWNAGGLGRLNQPELIVNHSQWIADIGYTFMGFALPLRAGGTLGINVIAMTMDEMTVTTYGNEEGTGETFKAGSYALGLAYGKELTDRFSIGANVKLINEFISHSSAKGLALDLGTLFITPFKSIRFGASISNFGQKMQIQGEDLLVVKDIDEIHHGNNESVNAYLATDRFDLPLFLRVGFAGELIDTQTLRISWAIDGIHPNDNSEYVNVGFETSLFGGLLSLRGGLKSLYMDDREEQFTLGGGVRLPLKGRMKIDADYAYESFLHLKTIQKFTIRLVF
ncbi:MAG: PorV/PorQ family protein [Fidelibacterota bacterium]